MRQLYTQTSTQPISQPHLPTGSSVSWEEAVREFLLHKKATSAPDTVYYFDVQLRMLVRWANAESISFEVFGKRHMDRYTAWRAEQGKSRLTLRHDGVCAKNLFDWCAKNELIDRSKLAEYEVHNAPKPHKHMPSDEEVIRLLQAIGEYWNPRSRSALYLFWFMGGREWKSNRFTRPAFASRSWFATGGS